MTENSPPNTPITPTEPRRGRAGLIVTAALSGLLATVLLLGGGLALWANAKKDDDGYLSTSRHQFASRTAALATENLDVDLDGVQWIVDSGDAGKGRLQVTSKTGKPMFVGIARTRDVDAYLNGVAHTTVTDVDYGPFGGHFDADYRFHAAPRTTAEPPARQRIWTASAQGSGTQTLDWRIQEGNWSVVLMNADGSPGVRADVKAGAKVPYLTAIGWTAIGGGILFLAVGSVLIAVAVRRRPAPPAAPTQVLPVPAT
jgi:hypothetical protein